MNIDEPARWFVQKGAVVVHVMLEKRCHSVLFAHEQCVVVRNQGEALTQG